MLGDDISVKLLLVTERLSASVASLSMQSKAETRSGFKVSSRAREKRSARTQINTLNKITSIKIILQKLYYFIVWKGIC